MTDKIIDSCKSGLAKTGNISLGDTVRQWQHDRSDDFLIIRLRLYSFGKYSK